MGFLAPLAGILGGVGSLFGGLFGANASSQASQQYMQALEQAEKSLQGNMQQGLGNFSPYMQGGAGAEGLLSEMLGTPGQGLLTPWTQQFQAPTAAQAAATPGYQFQLQQGENAVQNSAAGQGGLLSGGTLAAMNQYGQGVASTNYQNQFNNALTQYQSAYNTFLNNQQNTYGMLSGQAGMGLQAAGQAGNLISGIGGDIASLMGQKGAAQAGGTLGSANSILGMIPGLTGSLSQLAQTAGGPSTFGFGLGTTGPAIGAMQPSMYDPSGGLQPPPPTVPFLPSAGG